MRRPKGSAPSSLDAAQALIEESVITRWQHWRSWLTLQLERLTLREAMEAEDAGFDLDDAPQSARLREVDAKLAAIPAAERGEFQAAYEERRASLADEEQRNGAAPRDLAEVERAALQELLKLCMGDPAADQLGQVPLGGRWYRLDTRALSSVPSAAHYSVGATRGRRADLSSVVVMVCLAAVVFGFIWLQNTGRPAPRQAAEAPALLVNAAAVATWRPITLIVPGADPASPATSLPIRSTPGDRWPSAATNAAGWRDSSTWPLELCVAREAMPAATARVQVVSEGAALVRTYQLAAATSELSAPASLLIRACGDPQSIRHGALIASAPLPSAGMGEAQALTGQPRIALLEAAVAGPGQEPDVPAGRTRVTIRVAPDAPIDDWSALRPRLQLATGALTEPIANPTVEPDGRTALTYLVASYEGKMAAAWQVSDLSSGETIRWRIALPAPLSRAAYLDEHVRIELPRASAPGHGQLRLDIPLTTDTPLIIRHEDIIVRQGDAVIPVPAFSQEVGTLTPGGATTLTLDLLLADEGREVTVAIGRAVFAIQIPERR